MKPKELGRLGERLAQQYLRSKGYRILDINFRCPYGEIDIVAQDQDCLAFVEVKARRSSSFGPPEESITDKKKKKLISSSLFYLQQYHPHAKTWRIDVLALELDKEGKPSRIELISDAVNNM
jgi:putative endonuclease